MAQHYIKCHPDMYRLALDGRKRFEYRKNDRDYQVGDVLTLEEFVPATEEYTGRRVHFQITFILESMYGVPEGYCVMSIRPL